jgi:hypothetical protein
MRPVGQAGLSLARAGRVWKNARAPKAGAAMARQPDQPVQGERVDGFEELVGAALAGDAHDGDAEGGFVVARVSPLAFERLIQRVAAGEVELPDGGRPTVGYGRTMPRPRSPDERPE